MHERSPQIAIVHLAEFVEPGSKAFTNSISDFRTTVKLVAVRDVTAVKEGGVVIPGEPDVDCLPFASLDSLRDSLHLLFAQRASRPICLYDRIVGANMTTDPVGCQ